MINRPPSRSPAYEIGFRDCTHGMPSQPWTAGGTPETARAYSKGFRDCQAAGRRGSRPRLAS